jgi:uncharacterized protein YjbJ (UPF0337 family)
MNLPKDPIIKPIQAAGLDKESSPSKETDGKSCCDKTPSKEAAKSGMAQQHGHQSQEQSAPGSKPENAKSSTQTQPTQPQQQQSSTMADRMSGKWNQYVGEAKVTWGKLTDDEILKSEGNMQKLGGLVEERYAISREKADEQVKKFLDACDSKKS